MSCWNFVFDCWLTTFFFNINAISWVATIQRVPVGSVSWNTISIKWDGTRSSFFFSLGRSFSISFRRYGVGWRRDADNWFSCCGQWNGPLIFFQKLNGLEWTAVCRQGARAFVFFFFREIVNQVPTAFPIVRVNKASSFFFFSFHRLILIFGRAGLVAHRLLCCCCCCL